jgi:hypothetical protein
MDKFTRTNLGNLSSDDREFQNKDFFRTLEATDKSMDWVQVVWKKWRKA